MSMVKIKVNLTDPSDKGESVEVATPGGTVRVSCGLVQPATGRRVVLVEIEQADGWPVEVKRNTIMGRVEIRQVQG